jgi:hypothetical protein
MNLLILALALPLALDGESASGNSSALDIVLLVSIVGGYLLLAALWYFVFREKAREKHRDRPPD